MNFLQVTHQWYHHACVEIIQLCSMINDMNKRSMYSNLNSLPVKGIY